jgi:hypothetical protein
MLATFEIMWRSKAYLSPVKDRIFKRQDFSGRRFANLRLLKNNTLCVRVSLPLIAILTYPGGFFQSWKAGR